MREKRAATMKISVLLVMAGSALVAGTGFLREVMVAYLFGTSAAADAFSLILVYIEGLYVVISLGLATYMLVPLVVRLDHEAGRAHSERLTETLQLWTTLLCVPTMLVAWLAPDAAAWAMAPGFSGVQHALLADLVPAGAACAALLMIGGLFGGVLQAREAYLGPIVARGAFNVGIVVVLVMSARDGTVQAAARGLLLGGILQALVQLVALLRLGWRPAVPRFTHLHLGSAVASGFPIVLGLFLVNVVALAVQRAIGSHLEEGSLAAVNYAQRTLSVVSFLSLSIGTVSLTRLSTAVTQDPTGEAARAAVAKHLAGMVWLIVPLSVWLVVAAPPLVALLFQRGAYTGESAALTAECLRWFATALVPGGLLAILHRAGSAWHRNWLVAASSAGLAVTTMGVTLIFLPVGATALPIALLCGNVVGAALHAWLMRDLVGLEVIIGTLRLTARSTLVAGIAFAPVLLWQEWFSAADGTFASHAVRLLAGLGLAGGLYIAINLATGDPITREVLRWRAGGRPEAS